MSKKWITTEQVQQIYPELYKIFWTDIGEVSTSGYERFQQIGLQLKEKNKIRDLTSK